MFDVFSDSMKAVKTEIRKEFKEDLNAFRKEFRKVINEGRKEDRKILLKAISALGARKQ